MNTHMYNTIELFLRTLNLKINIVKISIFSAMGMSAFVLQTTALRYIVRMVSSNVTTVYRYFYRYRRLPSHVPNWLLAREEK